MCFEHAFARISVGRVRNRAPTSARHGGSSTRAGHPPEKKKLVDGVYGYFNEEGSHPGISDHSAVRISKNVLLSFAFYILEEYDAWRNGSLTLK